MLALVLALTATSLLRRYVFSAIAIFCVEAYILPLIPEGARQPRCFMCSYSLCTGITRPRVIIMALILVIGVWCGFPGRVQPIYDINRK